MNYWTAQACLNTRMDTDHITALTHNKHIITITHTGLSSFVPETSHIQSHIHHQMHLVGTSHQVDTSRTRCYSGYHQQNKLLSTHRRPPVHHPLHLSTQWNNCYLFQCILHRKCLSLSTLRKWGCSYWPSTKGRSMRHVGSRSTAWEGSLLYWRTPSKKARLQGERRKEEIRAAILL